MAISQVLGQLAQKFEGEYQSAKEANIQRYVEAKNIYEQNVNMYAPGGGFGAGMESQIQMAKKQDVGSAMQHQISSGLFGVQSTGALGQQWESKVGMPARQNLEDLRMQRFGEAKKDLAGVIERREDEYPDFRLIADLYMQAAANDTSGMRVTLPSTKSAEQMYQDAMAATGGMGGPPGGSGGSSSSGSLGGSSGSYSYRPSSSYSGYTTAGTSKPASTSGGDQSAMTREGFQNWWNSLDKATKKSMNLTGAMGPGGYLSQVGWAAYKSAIQQNVSGQGTAYGDYQNMMTVNQPGAVQATADEYSQIVSRLNQQYGSPTGIVRR